MYTSTSSGQFQFHVCVYVKRFNIQRKDRNLIDVRRLSSICFADIRTHPFVCGAQLLGYATWWKFCYAFVRRQLSCVGHDHKRHLKLCFSIFPSNRRHKHVRFSFVLHSFVAGSLSSVTWIKRCVNFRFWGDSPWSHIQEAFQWSYHDQWTNYE